MRNNWLGRGFFICLIFVCLNGMANGGVLVLNHYNEKIESDYFLGESKIEGVEVKISRDKMGYPFPDSGTSSEAVDIGYTQPISKYAGLKYHISNFNIRQGTIEMFVKTNWDWDDEPTDKVETFHSFFQIPMEGGKYNAINLYWQGHYERNIFEPQLLVHIYDGQKSHTTGMNLMRGGDFMRMRPDLAELNWKKDTWHYLAFSWTPTKFSLFVDGILVQEYPFETPPSFTSTDGPIVIGNKHKPKPDAVVNALIDEVRISNEPIYIGKKTIPVPQKELKAEISSVTQSEKQESVPRNEDQESELPEIEEPERKAIAVGGPGVLYAEVRKYPCYEVKTPPVVDGNLNDPVWQRIPKMTGFSNLGITTEFAENQTVVKACYDENNFYIGIECQEKHMGSLRASATKRDDSKITSDDVVEVFLDADRTGERYVQLLINALGIQYDGLKYDSLWDGEWQTASQKAENRWFVEIAMSFKTLNASTPKENDSWRWNVCRDRIAGGTLEYSSLNHVGGDFHDHGDFGYIVFLNASPEDLHALERNLNKSYISEAVVDIEKFLSKYQREASLLNKVSVKEDLLIDMKKIEKITNEIKEFSTAGEDISLTDLNQFRLRSIVLSNELDGLGYQLALSLAEGTGKLPKGLSHGVNKVGDYWYLTSTDAVFVIDSQTGAVSGVWDMRTDKRYVVTSYDIYTIETISRARVTDERLDKVLKSEESHEGLLLVCQNPDVPGVTISKRYFLVSVDGDKRILSKNVSVKGKVAQKTLFRVSSNTILTNEFRDGSYYNRIHPTGASGDKRSLVKAEEITSQFLQNAYFTSPYGRSQVSVFNPKIKSGLGQYLFKINGEWSYPIGLNMSYWTPYGWEMSWYATFLQEEPFSAEMRYHIFSDNRLRFHHEYWNLPEYRDVRNSYPVNPVVEKTRYEAGGGAHEAESDHVKAELGFIFSTGRSDEHIVNYTLPHDTQWGDFPAGDDDEIVVTYPREKLRRTMKCSVIKDGVKIVKRDFPMHHTGFYNYLNDIWQESKVFKEHPNWVHKDKNGRPVKGVMPGEYWDTNFSPEFMGYLTERLLHQVDYYDVDVLYLDFGVGTITDWESGRVVQPTDFLNFLKRLQIEVSKRGKILFKNLLTGEPYYDFGYFEGAFEPIWGNWRNSAEPVMMSKLYEREGSRNIPLYWKGGNDPRNNYKTYTNHVLALGLMPSYYWYSSPGGFEDEKGQTDWKALFYHRVAYGATALEMVHSKLVDIELSPAWWSDLETEIEAYALQQGESYILTTINHGEERDVGISADIEKMGLQPKKQILVWQFYTRDPDSYPFKAGPPPEGWDRMFTKTDFRSIIISDEDERIKVNLPHLEHELVRLTVVTQVPAVIYSVEDQKTQLLLPETLGCKIRGEIDEKNKVVSLKATVDKPCELLVYKPGWLEKPLVKIDSEFQDSTIMEFDNEFFLLIRLKKGEHRIVVSSAL